MSEYILRPQTKLQRYQARHMRTWVRDTVQASLYVECDVSGIVRHEAGRPEAERIPVSSYVLHAAVQTLVEHPEVNAHLEEEGLCMFTSVRLGVMLQTPKGVAIGCLPRAERYDLPAFAGALARLRTRGSRGELTLSETRGASFHAVDLSAYAVKTFTPFLLPAALAMLGIGRVQETCRPAAGGCTPVHLITLNLTVDHRGIDGFVAAHFMTDLERRLRNMRSARGGTA